MIYWGKRFFTALLFSLAILSHACAQDYYQAPAKKDTAGQYLLSKSWVGGNLSLLFGDITLIEVSPLILYPVTNWFMAGAGASYIFYADRRARYASSIYAGRIVGRLQPIPFLFAHAETEWLNGEWIFQKRSTLFNVYLGPGIRSVSGGRFQVELSLLWNFQQDPLNPYPNPNFRAGFLVKL